MHPACPELEDLERHAADPSRSPSALADHVSACESCLARLFELTKNLSIFAELGDLGRDWNPGLTHAAPIPSQIGEFAIVREIGRGGMGVVYEARQRNPERAVALKVLRADHMQSLDRRRLFEREIRVLARLRHPGITAIFGSGSAEQGPYCAMELVQGVSLAEYAGRTGLALRPRLQLFLKICAAISYAHQHGVIHRDLKPGNVLVEDGGLPKVLDFGLARISEADVSGPSLAMDGGRLVGTLAYMSPEQTRGVADDIDLRSDVYSLGVMLFELLTGTLPYDVPRTSVLMAVRSICEAAPRRPSSVAASDLRLSRAARGDLDTIVLKALEKSPEARYQSVAALAEDIERFLTDQPIVARPASAMYQLRKFARRNRTLVGGMAAVFLALAAGLATTAWQAVRARVAERRAVAEAATSAEVNRFLTGMFAAVDPAAAGPDVRVVEILKRAAADMEGAFAEQPRVAIGLRETIGVAYKVLTLFNDADRQFQRGLELAKNELGENARETLRLRYHRAEVSLNREPNVAALEELRRIVATQTEAFGRRDVDTLMTLNMLAVATAQLGRNAEAEPLMAEALAGREATLGLEHRDTLNTMASMGILLGYLGRRDDSAEMIRRAHEISLRVRGPDHAETLRFASHVATLARTPAELKAVEPMYRDIVERGTRVYGPDHQQTLAFMVSMTLLLELRCGFEESIALTRDLIARLTRAIGERDPQTLQARATLARRLRLRRDYAAAEQAGRELLAVFQDVYGPKDPRTVEVMYELTHALNYQEKLEQAEAMIRSVLKIQTAALGDSAQETAVARTLLAEILRKGGRLDEARAAAEQAATDLRSLPPGREVLAAWADFHLGHCMLEAGQFAEAEPLLVGGRERVLAVVGDCHPVNVEMIEALVNLYRRWHAAAPAGGHDRQSREWETRLDALGGRAASQPTSQDSAQ